MGHAIYRYAPLRNERMRMLAPLHVQAAVVLRVQLDAGKQTDETERIGIPQKRGNRLDLAHVDIPADPQSFGKDRTITPIRDDGLFQPVSLRRIRLLGQDRSRST